MRSVMIYLLSSLAVLMGLGSITCVLVWKIHFVEELTHWRDNPEKMFSWHPVLMTLSIFFMGFGMLMYKVFPFPRALLKSLHALMMVLSMGGGALGLWAVLDSHILAEPQIPNFYSLHSWIGIFTLGLLGMQFLAGFTLYLFPCCSSGLKAGYYPFHKYFGLAVLGGATASALMGISEDIIFSEKDNVANLPSVGVTANVFGCSLFLFSGLIIFITTYKGFKAFN